jgi:AcrR family transcriptional regulator
MIKTNDQPAAERGPTTRERLFEAAMDVFAARGFSGTTTRAICEAAGANLALLNYHFGSKEALWGLVVCALNERLAAIARDALCEPADDLAAGVAAFLRQVVRALLADPRPMRVMVWAQLEAGSDPRGFDPGLFVGGPHPALLVAAYEEPVRAAIAFLESEQRAGRIPADVDCGVAVLTFYGLLAEPVIEPAVHLRILGRDPSDPAHAARVERHLVRSGLRLLGLTDPEETDP